MTKNNANTYSYAISYSTVNRSEDNAMNISLASGQNSPGLFGSLFRSLRVRPATMLVVRKWDHGEIGEKKSIHR